MSYGSVPCVQVCVDVFQTPTHAGEGCSRRGVGVGRAILSQRSKKEKKTKGREVCWGREFSGCGRLWVVAEGSLSSSV